MSSGAIDIPARLAALQAREEVKRLFRVTNHANHEIVGYEWNLQSSQGWWIYTDGSRNGSSYTLAEVERKLFLEGWIETDQEPSRSSHSPLT